MRRDATSSRGRTRIEVIHRRFTKYKSRLSNDEEGTMAKRVAFVTGGMGGIGTAICRRLAQEGHTVIAGCGPNSPRREKWLADRKAEGFNFVAAEGNVGDFESTKASIAKAVADVGPIDILVNNAGITRDGVFRKMSRDDWDAVMSTN